MTDLVDDPGASSAQSPRRKFSFKFPLGHANSSNANGGHGHDQSRSLDECGGHEEGGFSNKFGASGRHFSDELKNVTDIQVSGDSLLIISIAKHILYTLVERL